MDGRPPEPTPNAAGTPAQVHETKKVKLGAKTGITTFLPVWAPLSIRIYKIRTLLSTGFVDNALGAGNPTLRKALSGAAFRASAPAHWEHGR
jgi:hypothetical protein